MSFLVLWIRGFDGVGGAFREAERKPLRVIQFRARYANSLSSRLASRVQRETRRSGSGPREIRREGRAASGYAGSSLVLLRARGSTICDRLPCSWNFSHASRESSSITRAYALFPLRFALSPSLYRATLCDPRQRSGEPVSIDTCTALVVAACSAR